MCAGSVCTLKPVVDVPPTCGMELPELGRSASAESGVDGVVEVGTRVQLDEPAASPRASVLLRAVC